MATGDLYLPKVTNFRLKGGALVAGALLPVAFAPFELYWIAPISLALLFSIWQKCGDLRSAATVGFLFGIGQFGVGVSWVQVSIQQFGGVNLPISILLTLIFVAFMALFIALQGGAIFFLKRYALAPPLLWVLFEWIRSTIFGGFPWMLLGHTAPGTFYRGLAPLVGALGVSLFIALIALLIVQFIRRPERRITTLLLAAILLLSGWGSGLMQWVEPSGGALSVALVQGNIEQSEKWLPQNRQRTMDLYRLATERAEEARLVLWPETAIPAFRHQVEESFFRPLVGQLEGEGRSLLTGVPLREVDGGGYLNGLVMMGAEQGEYHKRHLVPFGEYLPLRELLGPVLDFIQIPLSDFSQGADVQTVLIVDGHPLSTTICYEIAYPELTFSQLPAAELLVTVSNDGWFGDSLAPYQHLQIAQMRALESARPLLRATNTGITAVIDADGEIIKQIPRSRLGILEATIQPMKGETPYLSWLGRS